MYLKSLLSVGPGSRQELRQVLSCESPAVFLHFPLEEEGPWGPFNQLRQVLAKARHLFQILLKALNFECTLYSH